MKHNEGPLLLCPAGSEAAFLAAVENGADAVYLGGKAFNARNFADNFEISQISALTRYAHLFGVKVLVTLNILIHNQEFSMALEYAKELVGTHIDAIIVQDIGLARVLRQWLPQDIEIHASTQMSLMNQWDVAFAKSLGLNQVVLAREVSLSDINRMHQVHPEVQLETFGHGALCSAYSGQCLMSSMMGGRSGNRGQCAQPCRMKYRLLNSKGNPVDQIGPHPMSTKDLCTLDHLKEMKDSGVHMLKMEGRMKRPEYVAQITDLYTRNRKGQVIQDKEYLPFFNRSYTKGYVLGAYGTELLNPQRPNHQGWLIGEVFAFQPKTGRIQGKFHEMVSCGDGIEIRLGQTTLVAGQVHRLYSEIGAELSELQGLGWLETKGRISNEAFKALSQGKGSIYMTSSERQIKIAQKSYLSQGCKRKIQIDLRLMAKLGRKLKLQGTDEDGINITLESDYIVEASKGKTLDEGVLSNQLNRFGNTFLEAKSLVVDQEEQVFVPPKALNQLRRDWTEMLYQKRLEINGHTKTQVITEPRLVVHTRGTKSGLKDTRPTLTVKVGSLEALEQALEAGAREIYFGGEQLLHQKGITDKDDITKALWICERYQAKGHYMLPRIVHDQQIKQVQQRCMWAKEAGAEGFLSPSPGGLILLRELGIENKMTDWSLNLYNRHGVETIRQQGATRAALSLELTLEDLNDFDNALDLEVVVHGRIPLMFFEHCLMSANQAEYGCLQGPFYLEDRLGFRFPFFGDENGRNWLFNAKTHDLLSYLPALARTPITHYRIEGQEQDPDWIGAVTKIYLEALSRLEENGYKNWLAENKTKMDELAPQGYTTGHYFRGVTKDMNR